MLAQTDSLFREMVSTIALTEDMRTEPAAGPELDLFACLNSGPMFRAGQRVGFRMIGEPGGTAWADLGDFRTGIPLEPVSLVVRQGIENQVVAQIEEHYRSTGHELTPELRRAIRETLQSREIYEGSYLVQPGEEAHNLVPKGYLRGSHGGLSSQVDLVGVVDIDAVPPGSPENVRAVSLDGKVQILWDAPDDEDVESYRVLKAATPATGFELFAATEFKKIEIPGLDNFQPVFVRLNALDRAGNTGPASAVIQAVPLPEPDLLQRPALSGLLSGMVTGKVRLTTAHSPYTVRGEWVVGPQADLAIEPGTLVEFEPGASLAVLGGRLSAYGRSDKPVIFRPGSGQNRTNGFGGLILSGAGEVVLQHLDIQGASVGIEIRNCAPRLDHVHIQDCTQAGLFVRARAHPVLTCCRVTNCRGMGGMVIEGEGVSVSAKNNRFSGNLPFEIQKHTPLQIDLSGNWWGSPGPDPALFLGADLILDPMLSSPPQNCQADKP
jgi:hypothetical protein